MYYWKSFYIYIFGTSTVFHSIIYMSVCACVCMYAFYNTLVSHNMHLLCNLKVNIHLFLLFILSKLIKKLFAYKFWLNRALQGYNAVIIYFENLIVELYVIYAFKIHVKFYINQILFTMWSTSLYFMYNFKLQKFAI